MTWDKRELYAIGRIEQLTTTAPRRGLLSGSAEFQQTFRQPLLTGPATRPRPHLTKRGGAWHVQLSHTSLDHPAEVAADAWNWLATIDAAKRRALR